MYQFRDKKQIARKKQIIKIVSIFVVFSFLSILIIVLTIGGFWNKVGSIFWKSKIVVSDGIVDSSYLIRTKESVFNRNRELVIENINLNNQILDYQILKDENIKLKELLGRIPQQHNFILANILLKPNNSPYDTIVIDIGQNLDIKEGSKVYANGITPIGEVDKVYADTASVTLYSSPGKKILGIIEGSELSSNVELIGRGGGNFEMTVPVDLTVEKGKNILLPNIETEIVAITEDIISASNDPVKKFILRSPVNVQDLKWVQVLKN
jgi:cell shape-determining protein MreC